MAKFAARTRALAVEVSVGARYPQTLMQTIDWIAAIGRTENIDRDDIWRIESCIAEREIENSPQMLLELRRHRAFDAVMPRIVWASGDFIDQQASAGSEQLHRHDAGDIG